MSIKGETIIGPRAIKAGVQEYGGVQNVPITMDMVNGVKKVSSVIY